MVRALAIVLVLTFAPLAPAAEAPPGADARVAAARAEARASGKSVLVVFHASWCSWCRNLDAFLARPDVAPLFAKSYVAVHLDVLEDEAHGSLETPGGRGLMARWHGADQGLPFLVMLDPDGRVLADSLRREKGKVEGIGFPTTAAEIAHFMTMLERSAPRLTAAERARIERGLRPKAASVRARPSPARPSRTS